MADPRPPESRFSITAGGKSAFRRGRGGVSGPSSGRSFPLPCPFPSPEISVLSSSYPSERVHIRQLRHSGQGLSRWEAYLMSDRHSNLSPGLEVQSPPISSPLFPCRQEKSPWERGQAADFHTLEHTHLRVPKTMDPRLASVGSGQRGWPLLHWPFLEAHRVASELTPGRGRVEMATSLSLPFSVFPVSPPFSSPLILTHHTPIPFSLKSYLCLYKLLSLMSLLCVALLVWQLLQVSAKTRWRI